MSDTISRQAAIRIAEQGQVQGYEWQFKELIKLPPVTPKSKTDVLDKIRAEIEALPKTYPFVNHFDMYVKEDDVRKIIDKYKAESEE